MEDSDQNPAIDPADVTPLEERLSAWRPSIGALDRDRVLYEAGYAAGRAESRVRVWRLATAALMLISLGASGLAARERFLRMREWSRQVDLEITNVERAPSSGPAPAPQVVPKPPERVEPFAPSSYFALTSRLAEGAGDLWSTDYPLEPESRPPAAGPMEAPALPLPLRAGDVQRVLDL